MIMPGDQPPASDEIFRDAPCGLVLAEVDGMIVRVNDAFCRWVGFDATDLVGKKRLQDLLTIGGRVFHQTHCAPLLKLQRSVAELKLDLQRSDGRIVPVLVNASRQLYGESEFDQFAMLVVAERHKYERELLLARKAAEEALAIRRAAQKALLEDDHRKTVFLATLAHELRNPLAPMRNVLELLAARNLADPQLLWAHGVFDRQLKHMTHLVDDLLEVSRITQGKLELRNERVELSALIQQAVEASGPMLSAAGHEFVVALPTDPIWLFADPTRLSQMIQNLLNNAAKYTPAGGKIWLDAGLTDGQAQIIVRDSGIGIAEEDLTKIFDVFSQLTSGAGRSQGGLGIGLSLVRALVELHGGTVQAASKGPGKGSEFIIRLPAQAENIGEADALPGSLIDRQAGQSLKSTVQPQRVLVVDDNEDAAASLAMVLELEGHIVEVAFSGATAFAALEAFDAQIVVLDIGLPDINGYEMAQQIRQMPRHANALLIAITGWGQAKDKANAKTAGFDFHFTKPVDIDLLRTSIGSRDDSEAL